MSESGGYQYGGEPHRTEDSVVRVTLRSLERGETTRYLAAGEEIDMPADRVEVEVLDDAE